MSGTHSDQPSDFGQKPRQRCRFGVSTFQTWQFGNLPHPDSVIVSCDAATGLVILKVSVFNPISNHINTPLQMDKFSQKLSIFIFIINYIYFLYFARPCVHATIHRQR